MITLLIFLTVAIALPNLKLVWSFKHLITPMRKLIIPKLLFILLFSTILVWILSVNIENITIIFENNIKTPYISLSVIPVLTDSEILQEIARVKRKNDETIKKLKSQLKNKPKKGEIEFIGYPNKDRMDLKATGFYIDCNDTNWYTDLEILYKAFTKNKKYKNFGKIKGVFIKGLDIETNELKPLHNSSVILKNNTTYEEYYNKVLPFLMEYWNEYYLDIVCHEFFISVYNLDSTKGSCYTIGKNGRIVKKTTRSYSTKTNSNNYVEISDPKPVKIKNKNVIKALKIKTQKLKNLATVDIETIIVDKNTGIHVPIAISTYSEDFKKLFIVDDNLLKKDVEKAVNLLFKEYFDFMVSLNKDYVIYAHNLGGYDGYFIYREFITLVKDLDDLTCLLDPSNKFINITLRNSNLNTEGEECFTTLIWKDSLRLFPGSLESLCKQFNVEGKISKYNPEYNTIELFDKPQLLEDFKLYSLQDSIALYNALINAQKIYSENYKIDICDVVSTASLAFKIFRTHHLKKEIPLLTSFEEKFVRSSYLGGATDYYKAKGENIYWYDINSLYPYAMLQPVPYKVIAKHNDLSGVNVKDFKGFVYAKVTCPDDIKHPIVSLKYNEKPIYPRGSWEGIYFADYLAKAQDYGYKIELVSGIEFEYADLFSSYIKHFYEIKKNSKGSLKYLAKLKLNSLYGMFGRKNESVDTVNIKNEDIIDYLAFKVVKNVVDYGNGYSTIVCEKILDYETMSKLKLQVDFETSPFNTPTFASVAIASAITSRAQMIMMDYKNNPDFDVYYTDTDSIFTDKPLPKHLVGDELGQMKNETLDKFGVECIDKAVFVGLKKYGLLVTDKDGIKHELSTFAGVPKDTLSFEEVNKIHNGEVLVRNLKDRFNKSFNNMTIKTQSNVRLEVSNKRDKSLLDNNYIASKFDNYISDNKTLNGIIKRFNKIRKKYSDDKNNNPYLCIIIKPFNIDN